MKVLARKLRNHLNKEASDPRGLVVKLKNVRENGESIGCSGFIGNLFTGEVVYINTSGENLLTGNKMLLYREASDFSDFTGKRNRYAYSLGELVTNTLELCNAV